jgi:RNA polymerase sigma-70 factor (ECF subfamily)
MHAALGTMLIDILPRLRRYALSLSRGGDMADELVQAACERALATRSELQSEHRFDAWMFRIVRNLWFDRLRRLKTRGEELDIDARDDLAAIDGEKLPERRMLLRRVAAAIDALPEDQREIMLLVCVEGLAYREAADVLEVPIGTVMSRLARARKRVADEVGIESGSLL